MASCRVIDTIIYRDFWTQRYPEIAALGEGTFAVIDPADLTGDAVIHLNGHSGDDSPVSEVRIPVQGLDRYCEHLCAKVPDGHRPSLVDPRGKGEGTDMNIYDPFGNLTFWKA